MAAADHYGITAVEWCQCALSYHAALWQALRPRSPMERFERKLATDHRKRRKLETAMA